MDEDKLRRILEHAAEVKLELVQNRKNVKIVRVLDELIDVIRDYYVETHVSSEEGGTIFEASGKPRRRRRKK